MHRRFVLAGLAAGGAMPFLDTAAHAQSRTADAQRLRILMGGDYATATSEIAASRARNRAVRAFAELEIEEQAAVAKAFGARPGQAGVSERHAALIQQLDSVDRASFDRMYIMGQIKGHKELLALHRRYARSGTDPMARGASIVGVTGIETHLVMLSTIQSMLS